MQTFLPSTNFEQAAKWLDTQRLGKQRVECLQILKALTNPEYGWQNHPAVKMWRGYEWSLWGYAAEVCDEWVNRGYKDTCWQKICELMDDIEVVGLCVIPSWLTEEFASNHRSILLGKALENRDLAWDKFWELNTNVAPNVTKELKSLSHKHDKAQDIWMWYRSLEWTEQPAVKVDGKWPYLWPVK